MGISPFPSRVVLGVGGGIAAFKVCKLLRELSEAGHHVDVVPTANSLRFVGKATWEALSGRPVATEVWESVSQVPHVMLGQRADLVVVAPATADLLARAAQGLAQDLLGNVLLTARCPVLFAPGMHTEMWEHPATVANVATLRGRGAIVLDPVHGRLTGEDTGIGRMAEPLDLFAHCTAVLARGSQAAERDLTGRRVVVCVGGTAEPVGPDTWLVRRVSPRRGLAMAAVALARGAEVSLIRCNESGPVPAGARVLDVETSEQLAEAVRRTADGADALVFATAHPARGSEAGPFDPLAVAAGLPNRPAVLVQCATTADGGELPADRSAADLEVRGTEREGEAAVVLAHPREGAAVRLPAGSEELVADRVWDLVHDRLQR